MPHHTLFWCVLCLITATVTACSNTGQRQARLSGVVAIVNQGESIEAFLKSPGLSYMQTQVRIDERLADDVIFAIDQEFIEGVPLVHFDDAEGGIIAGEGSTSRVFSSDFESNHQVLKQPLTLPLIKLSNYKENQWYFERDEAIFRIEQSENAFSGSWVGVADVNLSEP